MEEGGKALYINLFRSWPFKAFSSANHKEEAEKKKGFIHWHSSLVSGAKAEEKRARFLPRIHANNSGEETQKPPFFYSQWRVFLSEIQKFPFFPSLTRSLRARATGAKERPGGRVLRDGQDICRGGFPACDMWL